MVGAQRVTVTVSVVVMVVVVVTAAHCTYCCWGRPTSSSHATHSIAVIHTTI